MKIKQFVKEIFRQVKCDWYMPVTEHQIYDTTERVIGTYMGKPLYRKVVELNTLASVANTTTQHGISDMDQAPFVCGYWFSSNGAYSIPIPRASKDAEGILEIYADRTNVYLNGTITSTMAKAYAILEYTKTTDTATESKVPFEPLTEYSTEERMIGYWIDGKPIYRKVIELSTTITARGNTWNNVEPIADEEIESLIRIDFFYRPGKNSIAGWGQCMDGYVKIYTTSDAGITTVILEYTKTTD